MEEVFVVAIIFGSALAAIKMGLSYRRDRLGAKTTTPSDPSLTTSELKSLITEAVEEALDRRISKLEKRLEEREKPRLYPATETPPDETAAEHPAPPLVARDRDITQ